MSENRVMEKTECRGEKSETWKSWKMDKSKKAPRNSIEWSAADLNKIISESNDERCMNYELLKFRLMTHTHDIVSAQHAAGTTDFAKVWMSDVV